MNVDMLADVDLDAMDPDLAAAIVSDRAERAAMFLGLDVAERYTTQDAGPLIRYLPSAAHPGEPWVASDGMYTTGRYGRGDLGLLEIDGDPGDLPTCGTCGNRYGCVHLRNWLGLTRLMPTCPDDAYRLGADVSPLCGEPELTSETIASEGEALVLVTQALVAGWPGNR